MHLSAVRTICICVCEREVLVLMAFYCFIWDLKLTSIQFGVKYQYQKKIKIKIVRNWEMTSSDFITYNIADTEVQITETRMKFTDLTRLFVLNQHAYIFNCSVQNTA